MEGELGSVGVEGGLLSANGNQALELGEHVVMMAQRVRQLCFQSVQIPLPSVDGTQTTGVLNPLMVVLSAQQAVDVERRNPFQGQHNGVSADKAVQLPMVRASLRCSL